MSGRMRVGDSVGQLKPSEDDNYISQLDFSTVFLNYICQLRFLMFFLLNFSIRFHNHSINKTSATKSFYN